MSQNRYDNLYLAIVLVTAFAIGALIAWGWA